MSIRNYLNEVFPILSIDKNLMDEMEKAVSTKSYSKGEIVIDYGSYIQFVPLVVKGLLKVMRENDEGKEVLLYYLGPGNSCAASFSCCMIRKKSEIKAVSVEDSVLIAIPLSEADRWMGKYSTWRNFILEMYDHRLFDMIDTIDHLAFTKLDEKLWDYLWVRSRYSENKEIHASHFEIASDLNSSRETISRLLKKLETQNKIALERNKIKLLS